MAEFIMKDMVKKTGREDSFVIASAAVSSEELGSPVYPPVRRLLSERGISCEGKYARKITSKDYEDYDFIVGMDEENIVRLYRFFGGDPEGKIHNLLDFAGRIGEEIPDPWYTRDFDSALEDVCEGCLSLYKALTPGAEVTLDFSDCAGRGGLYKIMRERMLWQEDYGSNLDALYDVLTGLPYYGSSFALVLPRDEELRDYALRVADIFNAAGVPVEIK